MFDKFRDECGVFGIFGHPEASNLAYPRPLRAPASGSGKSAGIAASDGHLVRVSKAMGYERGLRHDDARQASRSHGSRSRAHSTAGESRLANAQPILVDSVHGSLSLTTATSSTPPSFAPCRQGAIFQATTDTEVIVHLFARSREDGAEAAIIDALAQVRGAYSLGDDDERSADWRTRSAWIPAAGHRQARQTPGSSALRHYAPWI